MDDFLSEMPRGIRLSGLETLRPKQWHAGERFAKAKFEVMTQVGTTPGNHEEVVERVRAIVRGAMNHSRVILAQTASVEAALSRDGDEFVAAIGMGLGIRLTVLLTDFLRSAAVIERRSPSNASWEASGDPRITNADFVCGLCGQKAATVRIVPAGVASPDSMGMDMQSCLRIQVAYLGEHQLVLEESDAARLLEVLSASDPRGLHTINEDWARFYCPYCDQVYCSDDMIDRTHLEHAIHLVR